MLFPSPKTIQLPQACCFQHRRDEAASSDDRCFVTPCQTESKGSFKPGRHAEIPHPVSTCVF